jgi:hypothetical protein
MAKRRSDAAGMCWYRREDYPRIREIMVDAHVLPPTYDEWQRQAERRERAAQDKGLAVIRAMVEPDEFLAWCAREDLNLDANARTMFAAQFAMLHVDWTR